MNVLDLNKFQRPASEFPERAEVYVCDVCGRDITKHLPRRQAHVWDDLGPPFYTCKCGTRYRTFQMEWDSFSYWEKRDYVVKAVVPWVGIGVLLAGFLLLARLAFLYPNFVTIGLTILCAIPAAVLGSLFMAMSYDLLELPASLWRTRVADRFRLRRPPSR